MNQLSINFFIVISALLFSCLLFLISDVIHQIFFHFVGYCVEGSWWRGCQGVEDRQGQLEEFKIDLPWIETCFILVESEMVGGGLWAKRQTLYYVCPHLNVSVHLVPR